MDLDLSLPEPPERKERRLLPTLTFVGVIAAIALLSVIVLRGGGDPAPAGEELYGRELAETLERKMLYREAAALWEELAATDADPATTLFRAGKCRMLAGEPERGIRDLLAAEARGLPEDLTSESSRLVLEAYAILGKFAVRSSELEVRTGGDAAETGDVVARVGEEAVTRDELHAALRDEEAMRLLAVGGLDRDSLDRAVSARLADPKRLVPTLERILSRRALSLEALARGLGESPELSRRLAGMRRELLANLLVEDRLLEGVRVSEADLEEHWKAHPERYTEPEAVRYSWGPPEAASEDLVKVDGWHAKGDSFPDGLGRSAEADALLFVLEPGGTADRTVRIGEKDFLLRTEEKRPSRLIPFAEARARVAGDLLGRKRAEAIQALRAEVEARHPVEIVDGKLREARQEANREGR